MKKLLTMGFLLIIAMQAQALTINLNYIGGTAMTTTVGGGDLTTIVRAAANQWEQAIPDAFTLTLDYGYTNSYTFGQHSLVSQMNGRETSGMILFGSLYNFPVYMDPTPDSASEYTGYYQTGLPINGIWQGERNTPLEGFGDTWDMFSCALHEIGHALGLDQSNLAFLAEAADGYINITSGDYTGYAITLDSNNAGYSGHLGDYTAMGGIRKNQRTFLSDLDILAVSQVEGFGSFNMNQPIMMIAMAETTPSPVPEPTTLLLLSSGLVLLGFMRRPT
jgi:hypothetical protein